MASTIKPENIGQLIERQQQELHDATTAWREALDKGHADLRHELHSLDNEQWQETMETLGDIIGRGDETRVHVEEVNYGVFHSEIRKRLDQVAKNARGRKLPVLISAERAPTNVGRFGKTAGVERVFAIVDITEDLK